MVKEKEDLEQQMLSKESEFSEKIRKIQMEHEEKMQ